MSGRSSEERARAEVERVKAAEQAEQDRRQARREELAAEASARREAEAERGRQEEAEQDRWDEAERAADREREKRAAFRTWTAQGGAPGTSRTSGRQ